MDNRTAEIREKLLKGEKLTEEELISLSFGYESDTKNVAEMEGNDHRWYREVTTVFYFKGYPSELWAIEWGKGLTEMQENQVFDNPYRVKEVRKTVTTEVVTYEKI